MDDRAAQRSLGGVVGRLDPLDRDKGPKRGPDLQQVAGEAAVVAGALALASGALHNRAQLSLDGRHLPSEAIVVAVP